MEDLERGVENPWSQHWWHVLQHLKFLIDVRYDRLDPYYYIVHSKFAAQVRHCSIYERLMQPVQGAVKIDRSLQMTPWELEEERHIKKETKQREKAAEEQKEQAMQKEKQKDKEKQKEKQKEKEKEKQKEKEKEKEKKKEKQKEKENKLQPNRITVKTSCKKHQEEDNIEEQKKKGQKEQNDEQDVDKEEKQEKQKKVREEAQEETKQVQQANEKEQTESVLICTLQEAADEQEFLAHLESVMEPLPETALNSASNLPTVEPYQVTRMLRCYPASYGKADTRAKRQAWVQVAKELNTTGECSKLSTVSITISNPSLPLHLSLSLQSPSAVSACSMHCDSNVFCK